MAYLSGISKDNTSRNVHRAAEIFAEYGDFIRSIIQTKVKDKDKAHIDDLFQDLFLSLILKPLPIDTRNIPGCLYRAVTYNILDAERRLRRQRQMQHEYFEIFKDEEMPKNPGEVMIQIEEANKLFSLIEGQLRRTESRAIVLRYKRNLSTKEAAEKMGVTPSSVRKYISNGLRKINQTIAGNFGERK